MSGPEKAKVEDPFIDQLVRMGWEYVTGNIDYPSATGRASFREVLLLDDLRRALRTINRTTDGKEWLDDGRISTAASALERLDASKLMEANEAVHNLLLTGVSVEGVADRDGGRMPTVHFIDWANPERNRFTVVSQFRIDEPSGQTHGFITPDLVLFVNGIPLVVVECKAPGICEPMASAVDQLQRYANQRNLDDTKRKSEGNERLFHYNAFTIATCFDEARVGTVGAQSVHFLQWKDVAPIPAVAFSKESATAQLGKAKLSNQELLVAGMLHKEHLIDLLRHFIVFEVEQGRTIKKVARYQQFRAVLAAVTRLETGKTLAQDGEFDRRGGIIWHTQGSGKSLSMVFLARKMRSHLTLRRFKIVIVTDRRDLQKQLSHTAELTGDVITTPTNTASLQRALKKPGPGLVFAMIQKYQSEDLGLGQGSKRFVPFPVLNESDAIVVIIDEAHRSHAKGLHANLTQALPRCAQIGFTGTPIIMGAKKKTHEIFGDWIDRYTIAQSEADGSTLPILYEGRTTQAKVADGRDLDEVFEDMFQERSKEELEAIKAKYATAGDVLEAEKLIAAKAKNMLRHYVDNILPNGFKAQVVAVSRLAAMRYQGALVAARDELLRDIAGLSSRALNATPEEASHLPDRTQFLLRARDHLDRLRQIEFAAVYSRAHNDPAVLDEWSDPDKVPKRIDDFKKPFEHKDPSRRSNLAFLIVKSMLITGFDAPIAQVQYLDRSIQEAELLQAIARVNRTYTRKHAGIVVDYCGVGNHLKKALKAYSKEDIADVEGGFRSIADELPNLRDRHLRVMAVFTDRDVALVDEQGCVDLLRDEQLRAEFTVKLQQFLKSLDTVLPRPEGLEFVADARALGIIAYRARQLYRDHSFVLGKDVGEKVRALIDQHIISLGIDPRIPPVSILDAKFDEKVKALPTPKARASEMEHALRYHIGEHENEDPEHFQKLSERLEGILTQFKDRWDEIEKELKDLLDAAIAGRGREIPGLNAETHAPFFGVLKLAVVGKAELSAEQQEQLAEAAVALVDHIRAEIRRVGFWTNAHAQEVLRKWIVQRLDEQDILPFARLPEVADRLLEVAQANQQRLAR